MKNYKLAHNTIDNKDYRKMINFLKERKYLNQSKITKKFEKNFSNFLKTKYSIFVNSGSSANLLIAQTLLEGKYLKNKIAVLPAVSWSTTVSPFLQLGFKVVLCDCDTKDLGLCPKDLERICKKYNPGLVAIVNVLGHANNFQKILSLKKRYNFKLIEDNCESLGSHKNKKNLGTFGLASSHSFYFGHHISTIEGGMVSTSDKKFYNISLAIRSHGWARDVEKSFRLKLEKKFKVDEFKSLYTFYYSGLNIRSTDFNANIGVEQIKKIKSISKIRNRNFNRYKSNLKNFWSQDSNLKLVSSFGYATFVKNRLDVFKYLKSKNIQTRPLICGNMGQQPFWRKAEKNKHKLSNAKFVDKYGLYLPNHANLSLKDIDFISKNFSILAKPIFF
ncbi:MAG: aminotransferase DegT [Pelagibacteraceae bacterium]|nr:aminotransferase DegT [Pelagibacteraceae bacterium]|tara:strand:- start:6581 stop:7747 length:1167 start_codon:yes stop_codon:yes gene_type:complete